MITDKELENLKCYFENRKDIAFAFLHGSQHEKGSRKLSNVNIAIYFYPEERHPPEYESDVIYKTEKEIYIDLKRFFKCRAELLILNRAVSTVAADALRGIKIAINDWGLYLDFMLFITALAADFMEFRKKYDFEKVG